MGSRSDADDSDRGQSNVVGVALLVGIAVIGIGGLTAGIGSVVDGNVAAADAASVANGLDRAIQPIETTGQREAQIAFAEGRLTTDDRTLRVLNDSGVVATVPVDALVYESSDRRVAYEAGAIVRGGPGNSWLHAEPSITASRGAGGVLVIGAPALNGSVGTVSGAPGQSVRLSTLVTHDRRELGDGNYRVAVETPTPGAWNRHFESEDAVVRTTERRFAGDDHRSVVAEYRGNRTAYLVVHDVRLEVGRD